MLKKLEDKMEEIGDEPAHPVGISAAALAERYPEGGNIAQKAEQHNL